MTHWFMPLTALAQMTPTITPRSDGLDGVGDGFSWMVRFKSFADGYWVDISLDARRELVFTPTMAIWLGELDDMDDRQAHTWRQTVLRGPTTNQQGLNGNDLPAGLLYDHHNRTATILYIPPDSLGWLPHRFYEWRIRDIFAYQPIARYGIGLAPSVPDVACRFARGMHHFRLWYAQITFQTAPTAWDAQYALLQAIEPLLDTTPRLLANAIPWEEMARHTLRDLDDPACWVSAGGREGLRAYVGGSSAVGRDQTNSFELMTQLDVLLPLLHWRRATDDRSADPLIERLLDAVRVYDSIPLRHYLPNHYPYQPTDTFMDTWYFYENALIKLPWVAHLTGDADLRALFLNVLEGGRTLAHNTQYLFPLFADASDWRPRHSLLNVSVGGLYAAGCVLAYQMTGEPSHLDEARAALNTLYQLPPDQLLHEPQQLSFAAASALFLAAHEDPPRRWQTMARDFVLLSLRMGYWGADPLVSFYDPRGMFQACASLSYPAYKENVEVIWAWSELLDANEGAFLPTGLMAAFANLQRCHNYAFFDPFLPPELRRGPCPYIPYEDLATTEFPHTATFGKELYGAGEVFWSALLFPRPFPAPQDALIFSLDVPCLRLNRELSARRWLVYNPREEALELGPTPAGMLSLMPKSFQIIEGD